MKLAIDLLYMGFSCQLTFWSQSKMELAAPLLILFSILFDLINSVASLIGGFTGNYLPESAGIFMMGSQVFLLLLAIVFSLINCFSHKPGSKLLRYILLLVSVALFASSTGWLLPYLAPST